MTSAAFSERLSLAHRYLSELDRLGREGLLVRSTEWPPGSCQVVYRLSPQANRLLREAEDDGVLPNNYERTEICRT